MVTGSLEPLEVLGALPVEIVTAVGELGVTVTLAAPATPDDAVTMTFTVSLLVSPK